MIILVLMLLMSATVSAQQRFNVSMEVEGRVREVIVQVPSGAVPSGGYPVVFMMHGTSGDGEKFYNISGWKELGESKKFVTCFPSSLRWCILKDEVSSGDQNPHVTTKWVNGDLLSVACDDQPFVDDVLFFRAMTDSLKKLLPVNPARFYVSGFSNGSCMSAKLMVEASDIFAAFASSSGSFHSLDSGDVATPRPYWFVFGTHDDRYYEPKGLDSLPFSDEGMNMFRGLTNRYLRCMKLEQEYEKDSNAVALTYTFTRSVPGGYPTLYRQSLLKRQTHEYPNGANHPFDAPQLFWQFFSQYTLPTSVEELDQEPALRLYPNPSSDLVTIERADGPREGDDVRIVDLYGRTVIVDVRTTTTTSVDVSKLPMGTYLVLVGAQRHSMIIAR